MGSRRVVQLAALLLVLWVTCVYGQGNRKSCYKGQLRINERLGEYFQEKDSIFWRTLLDGTVLKHGTEIRQRCKRDYELFGGGHFLFPQRYFFSKNNGGVWDPELAVCKPKRCDIPDTYHGAVSYDDESVAQGKLLHGTDVTTTCDEGYEIKRGQTVEVNTCKKGHLPVPRCSEIECMVPNVTVLIPGEMVKQSYKHGEEIRELTCDVGEELVGDSILVCQNDGTWHGTAACKPRVECIMPNVTALIPGEIVRKSYKPREEIRGLTCAAGEKLVGDSRLVCLDDVECHLPNVTALIPVAMVKQSYKPREEIRGLTCAAGGKLVGDSRLVCQDDGTWHGTAACINDCAAPPSIPNTDVSDGGTLDGDTRAYTCSPGYVLSNAITLNITCQHNSTWSTPSFDCLRDCYEPPSFCKATLSKGDTLEGSTRNYTCIPESTVIATPVSTVCQPNGTWTTVDLRCYTGECPSGWQQIGCSCYIVAGNSYIKLVDSMTFCQTTYPAYKTYLFQLETADEDDAVVYNILQNYDDTNFCLGLHDVHQNRTWMWMASNEPLTYSNWRPGQPDGLTLRQYYVIVSAYYNNQWADYYDFSTCQPVCEISLI